MRDDAMTHWHDDAKNARGACIGICQQRRKRLYGKRFLDSHSMRSMRSNLRRESRNVVNNAARGL
jgi:hypothetical protein